MTTCVKTRRVQKYASGKEYIPYRDSRAYNREPSAAVKHPEVMEYSVGKLVGKSDKASELNTKSHTIVFRIGISSNPIENVPFEKRQMFRTLSREWIKEASGQSSMSQALTPTYLKILTLGKEITPLILKELNDKPNFWFLALRALNDDNPVPKEHMGNVKKMREDWLAWGRQKHLI